MIAHSIFVNIGIEHTNDTGFIAIESTNDTQNAAHCEHSQMFLITLTLEIKVITGANIFESVIRAVKPYVTNRNINRLIINPPI